MNLFTFNYYLLFRVINAELFLSENKWLSLFFWQEYEMRTKPKCLDISKLRKTLETNEYEQESQNHTISDKLNGSFCSINTDTLSASDPTHEYKEFRNKVKAYMEVFKEHVFDADHPINIVAKHFKIKFSAYLAEKIKELYSIRNCEDIPDFNKLNELKGIKPQDLGINKKFCLNDDTLILQKNMATEKLENSNKRKLEVNSEHENLKRDLNPSFNKIVKYENEVVVSRPNNLRKIDELNFLIEDKYLDINEFSSNRFLNNHNLEINVDTETDFNSNANANNIDFKNMQRNKIEGSLTRNPHDDFRDSYEVRYFYLI